MIMAISSPLNFQLPNLHYPPKTSRTLFNVFSAIGTSGHASSIAGDDVLQSFLEERESTGDFIAKISDKIWIKRPAAAFINRNFENGDIADAVDINTTIQLPQQQEEDESGGFLKLKQTNEWILGDTTSAPFNKKRTEKEIKNDSEKRRKLNLLKYEALKREQLLLTVAIGTMCGGYCLVVFSFEVALSYAVGVFFSCLYLQLLWQHVDNLSKEAVPAIFTKKRSKKIGIRSGDLEDFFEKSIKGSSLALSSPRLAIPVAIYGIWELSQHFGNGFFDFQLLPAMVGIFAYKAAALVQVYRDNEDLTFIFPEN